MLPFTPTPAPTLLVTGGAGFIGANFVLRQVRRGTRVINLDALTYAGHLANLTPIAGDPNHVFVHGSIGDATLVTHLLDTWRPAAIIHFAAESHVDRSIGDASPFIDTNVVGTWRLLEAVRVHLGKLPTEAANSFRFVSVSTDEVYGSLGPDDPPFHEGTPFAPNSPYAASKAAADHFARAAFHTFGTPVITTHASNNFGPLQYPEKLIPLMVLNARDRLPLPVYGDGLQVRDWLHVDDHCEALERIVTYAPPGEVFVIGGGAARTNIDVVTTICDTVDRLAPDGGPPRRTLVRHVTDRLGHDRRYAIDPSKLRDTLDWRPTRGFDAALEATVRWYLEHPEWVESVRNRKDLPR